MTEDVFKQFSGFLNLFAAGAENGLDQVVPLVVDAQGGVIDVDGVFGCGAAGEQPEPAEHRDRD
jgi:hypothetical protein